MIVEIKVPTPGESINEVEIASWAVKDGDIVYKNQELAEIESDKATLSLVAIEGGQIKIIAQAGETVKVNSVACSIDTSKAPKGDAIPKHDPSTVVDVKAASFSEEVDVKPKESVPTDDVHVKLTPLAREVMKSEGISLDDVLSGLHRISASDVKEASKALHSLPVEMKSTATNKTPERQKMSQLRKKLSQRLVAVKNETAMLTTFNEVDMSEVMRLRSQYNKAFTEKYGVKLGFMSFFLKASALAVKSFPMVNAQIDGDEMVIYPSVDISVAVQTPKGLMVPVIRGVENLSLAEIELELKALADKARTGKLSLSEMTGGTFTITNGGVFGSMLSTPLINPPQSAILGMHNIIDRPVARNQQVVIRPMMYVALSYDHRIIDGKDSVGYLKTIKEMIENPLAMLTPGQNPEKVVLGL